MNAKLMALAFLPAGLMILARPERPALPQVDGAGLAVAPTLDIKTAASDDTTRNTGVMILGLYPAPAGWPWSSQRGIDLIAHYDVTVALNGAFVNPDALFVAVYKKDEVQPINKQFAQESLKTTLKDVSAQFVAMTSWTATGVSVIDVYFVGERKRDWVGDYIVIINADKKISDKYVWGSATQKLCVLGWSMGTRSLLIKLSGGDSHYSWDDPLGPFPSAAEAVIWQRHYLGLKIASGLYQ
jgi:hypothetical protein